MNSDVGMAMDRSVCVFVCLYIHVYRSMANTDGVHTITICAHADHKLTVQHYTEKYSVQLVSRVWLESVSRSNVLKLL